MAMNLTNIMTDAQKASASVLETCMMLCIEAHYGQRDRNGLPYCLHPIRVSNNVPTIRAKSLALIHDIVEDGPVGILEKMQKLLPYDLVQSCLLLSRVEGEKYANYIERYHPAYDRIVEALKKKGPAHIPIV